MLAAKRFRPYLHGKRAVVRTDHLPLVDMHLQPGHSPRRLRWLETLQEFDLDIVHVPGRENQAADALSRPPLSAADLFDLGDAHVSQAVE